MQIKARVAKLCTRDNILWTGHPSVVACSRRWSIICCCRPQALKHCTWGHYICAVLFTGVPMKTEDTFVSAILSRHYIVGHLICCAQWSLKLLLHRHLKNLYCNVTAWGTLVWAWLSPGLQVQVVGLANWSACILDLTLDPVIYKPGHLNPWQNGLQMGRPGLYSGIGRLSSHY